MSGLEFQTIPIEFRGEMDQKTNRKLLPAGKWNSLLNCSQSGDYALKLRDGVSTLVETNGNSLATLNNELLVIDGPSASSIGASGNPLSVLETPSATAVSGEVAHVSVTHQPLLRNLSMQVSADCSYGREHTCYVWRDWDATGTALGVSFAVRNEVSGAFVIPPTRMRTSANVFTPRVMYSAGCFFICYVDANTLYGRGILVTSSNLVGPVSAETVLLASPNLRNLNIDLDRFFEDELNNDGRVAVTLPWSLGDSLQVATIGQTLGVPGIFAGPTSVFTTVQLAVADFKGATLCWMNTPDNSGSAVLGVFACGNTGTLAGTAGRFFDDTLTALDAAFLVDANVSTTSSPTHIVAIGQPNNYFATVFTDQQCEWGVADAVVPVRRNVVVWTGTVSQAGTASTIINSATFSPSATTPAGPSGPFIYGKPFLNQQYVSGTAAAPIFTAGALMLPMCVMENYTNLASNAVNLNQQSTVFLMDATSGVMVGKALYGRFGVPAVNNNTPNVSTPCGSPEIIDTNTGITTGWGLTATERTTSVFERDLQISPTGLSRLTWVPRAASADTPLSRSLSNVQLGPVAYINGQSQYDTRKVVELGFPLFPEGVSVVNVAGGGAVDAGDHALCAVYEWLDGTGQRHQSAPSTPITVTSAAGDSIRVRVPTLLMSQKSDLTIVVYMTQTNGVTLNRVTSIVNPTSNTTAAAYVTFTATLSDAQILGNELLYTQPLAGGATTLANVAPNPAIAMCVHQNRLFMDRSDTEGGFCFSQELVAGVGLQFNETLVDVVPSDAGRITGFASMDDKLLIFCERKIFYVLGVGPNASGGFNNYTKPIEIPSDVGCNERRSIVVMPLGVVFLSEKGFYLLGRDLAVRYIGAGVDVLSRFKTVESAVLLGEQQQIRFGGSLYQLTLSYLTMQWSYDVITQNGGSSVSSYAVADSRWWPVTHTYVSIGNTQGLNSDVQGQQFDSPGGGSPVFFGMMARTSFIHLSALEGFQRVRRLGFTTTNSSAVAGTFTLTVDFDDLYQSLDPAGAPGSYVSTFNLSAFTTSSSVMDFRHKLHQQKCKSVAFTFETTPAAAATNIVGMQALALEVGVKKGTNKLPAVNSID